MRWCYFLNKCVINFVEHVSYKTDEKSFLFNLDFIKRLLLQYGYVSPGQKSKTLTHFF